MDSQSYKTHGGMLRCTEVSHFTSPVFCVLAVLVTEINLVLDHPGEHEVAPEQHYAPRHSWTHSSTVLARLTERSIWSRKDTVIIFYPTNVNKDIVIMFLP